MDLCEDCNYYTEKYKGEIHDNVPFCVKQNKKIKTEKVNCCEFYDNKMTCYDCPNRYEIHYEIDDIDHYCEKYKCLLLQQQRSVLYKGDFQNIRCLYNN